MTQGARYTGAASISVAEGWSLAGLTPPSRLFGANGVRSGPDGRVYVAQVTGSQISALDVETGELETISPLGGEIVAPDDMAFDAQGNLYATEYMDGRVSVRDAHGRTRVVSDEIPSANGITVHQGRLFVSEFRVGGRLWELDRGGGALRVLLEGAVMPNAIEVGPDGLLYYPAMGTNDIWRIHPDGGEPERVAGDLAGPDAVKFDSAGYLVSTQAATGEVLRINPRNGERSVVATVAPGLDNLTFMDGRLFVSSFTGEITELVDGGGTRTTLPGGLNWPLDVTVDALGNLFVADGNYFYALDPANGLQELGMMFSPGWPGFIRGAQAVGSGEFLVTTSNGEVARWLPNSESQVLAEGFDQLYGLALAPGGGVVTAEVGTGRIVSIQSGDVTEMARGLKRPLGVAFTGDGTCLVSESDAGRVIAVHDHRVETVVDGLDRPQGILVRDGTLHIVDAGAKELVAIDLGTTARHTLATNLPVGPPPGVVPKPLLGAPPFSGPQGPFAGIAAGPDGTLYVSADADGSVLALRKAGERQS